MIPIETVTDLLIEHEVIQPRRSQIAMPHPTHHLFLSYSRKDNQSLNGAEGWITAFYRRLQTQHTSYTGRELKIFFDTAEIDHGSDWKTRLGQGLRTSRLFLAFLSPNYMRSPNCRWEWEEYLRREHSLARGEDGIRTIFFEMVPGMPGVDADAVHAIENELRSDQQIARWLDMITEELSRRNSYLDPHTADNPAGGLRADAAFDLRPWFSKGAQILAELDAADRLEELRCNPEQDVDKILTLAERLKLMDQHIAARLDRCLLADLAPGRHSLGRSYPHFVGRHRELRQLHESLIAGKVGMVTAVHGLGGQGKTALAIQYAHAYADFYSAGGRWVIPCEGVTTMAEALMRLATQVELRFEIPPDVQSDPTRTVQFVLMRLEEFMARNASTLLQRVGLNQERMSLDEHLPQIEPRMLLILDNVDQPGLLSVDQLALLPQAEWFEMVVTTRLDPDRFGIGKDLRSIPVDSLPIDDAVALIRDYQPNQQFANAADEQGATRLCELLGGFTLSVELAAAYLGEHPDVRPGDYCELLLEKGLPTADDVLGEKEVAAQIRHREKQLSIVVDWTLARLDERARFVLDHASFLEPDSVMMEWLHDIASQRYPELMEKEVKRGTPNAWFEVWRQLHGLRLLTPREEGGDTEEDGASRTPTLVPAVAQIHRMIAAQVNAKMSADMSEGCWQSLIHLTDQRAAEFQESWPHSESDHWMVRPFGDNALHLARKRPCSRELAENCGVIGQAEMNLGSLARAGHLLGQCSLNLAEQFKSNPSNTQIIRAYALALNQMGNFHLLRGCAGDKELASGQFDDSLELIQQVSQIDTNSKRNARFLGSFLSDQADYLLSRGQSGDAETALVQLRGSLMLALHICEAKPNSAQAAREASIVLCKLGEFHMNRNQQHDAEIALWHFEESKRIFERIHTSNPDSIDAALNLSMSHISLGDYYRFRHQAGDSELTLSHLQDSLKLGHQVYFANPKSKRAARCLSVSHDRLGDFFRSRDQAGDAELALQHLCESHRILKQIYDANPGFNEVARDLSVSHSRLGSFFGVRGHLGDADRALEHLQASHQIRKEIYDANPNSADAARDLSTTLSLLGDFYRSRGNVGDPELVQLRYQEALNINQRLYDLNRNSVESTRELSMSYERLGDFLMSRGELEDTKLALGHFELALKLVRQLHDTNPKFAQAARDLGVLLTKLGDYWLARSGSGNVRRALQYFDEAKRLSQQSYKDNPDSTQAARDYMITLDKLVSIQLANGQWKRALENLLLAHNTLRQIYDANPLSAQAARDLGVALTKLGDYYLARGRSQDTKLAAEHFSESLKLALQLYELNPNSVEDVRNLIVSLERASDMKSLSGSTEALISALDLQDQALQLALKLQEADPASLLLGQTAAVSAYRTGLKTHAVGRKESAIHCLRVSFAILENFVAQGCELTPEVQKLYQLLKVPSK